MLWFLDDPDDDDDDDDKNDDDKLDFLDEDGLIEDDFVPGGPPVDPDDLPRDI